MIIDNFDVQRSFVRPAKADPPLLVDPNAPLARAITLQGFQTVAGRRSHVLQLHGLIQHIEFAKRRLLKGSPFRCAALAIKQLLRRLANEERAAARAIKWDCFIASV